MNSHYSNERIKSPHKKLIVTTSWDDGSLSDIKLHRLLEKHSLKSTFYVAKQYHHLERPLTSEEIIEISQKFEIGAHTLTHPKLDEIDSKHAKDEILGSKEYLEKLLSRDIKMFCYPYGRYNDETIRIVEEAGFIGARTCIPGDFDKPNSPYKWHTTLLASNASPLMALKIWRSNRLSMKSLINWEIRAKELFDLALERGGIYHLWGHTADFEKKNEWDKVEEVLSYISNRDGVQYMTNREVIESMCRK